MSVWKVPALSLHVVLIFSIKIYSDVDWRMKQPLDWLGLVHDNHCVSVHSIVIICFVIHFSYNMFSVLQRFPFYPLEINTQLLTSNFTCFVFFRFRISFSVHLHLFNPTIYSVGLVILTTTHLNLIAFYFFNYYYYFLRNTLLIILSLLVSPPGIVGI